MTDGERPRGPVPDAEWRAAFEEAKATYLGDERATCLHEAAGPTDHGCPTCGGTLRRCCASLVGNFQHRDGCPELARRATDAA